jgi:two-component system sensor histidine kinase UhpB
MSLRLRVLIAIVLVLVLGSGLGLALAGWQARGWLRDELWTAQLSAHLQVARDLADLPPADQTERKLAGLVATFNGNRHLVAVLLGPDGRVLAASENAPGAPPPTWFADLLRQPLAPARLLAPASGGLSIELRPVYDEDMSAVWNGFLLLTLVLALAIAVSLALVFVVVGQALQPLRAVGKVLPRIGAGDYAARTPAVGPPELAALGRGVNEMAARLAGMRERTRALEEQILTLQDEERADIARDLHDEIGPHLFAANVDAAMAAQLISSGRPEAALEQVRSITGAIAHIQRLVRDILGRLRPTRLAELGLASAVLDLAAFWKTRSPGLAVDTELPANDAAFPELVQETLYRIVQESLSNAVRHGEPSTIRIAIAAAGGEARVEVTNDGAGAGPGEGPRGYGLAGMAERVAAAGGVLEAGPAPGGGWRVAARLPLTLHAPLADNEAA